MQAMTAALIKIIRNRQEGKDAEKIADSDARKDGMIATLRKKHTELYEEFESFYEKLPRNVLAYPQVLANPYPGDIGVKQLL